MSKCGMIWKNIGRLRLKMKRSSKDWFFCILCIFLFPAIFFVISGSNWPIWDFVPIRFQRFFIEGDSTLYNFGITYIGSFIFYLMVNYFPDRKYIKDETQEFLEEIQQYMFTMASAICCELNRPESFYLKLYRIPKEPKTFYKRDKYQKILVTLYSNYRSIEGSYNIYLCYFGKENSEEDEEYLNKHIEQLEKARMAYYDCANKMIKLLKKR